MAGAYTGKLLFVDLTKKTLEEKEIPEDMMKNFIGGYGIGARILYDMVKPDADPLGPENIIGFMTGLLSGTGAMFSGRYTVICKSPVYNGWNDANSGGHFGPELKKAGYDGVIVSGISNKPVYIYINDGRAEIRDAEKIWGMDCVEGLKALIEDTGEKKIRAALIGPAGEKLSPMSCIINDSHRAAGRGGSGAVMGSKRLKAVVVRGTAKITPADPDTFRAIAREVADGMKNGPMAEVVKGFGMFGTSGNTHNIVMSGDCPVKNWSGAGAVDMGEEEANKLSSAVSYDSRFNSGKYACANCPLGCGAHYQVDEGRWPVGATERPEYETIGAFGAMMLNSNAEAIIKCNDLCNRYGMDTISVGCTVAWAMECYEKGILSKEETDGIELTWGNADAIVEMTQAIADQKGLGRILALGSKMAAEKLGKGSEYLQTVRGIELPMHDSRLTPGFARTYQHDPTPGRHTKGGLGVIEMMAPPEVRYNYEGKGPRDARATFETEITNCAGFCAFSNFGMPMETITRYIAAATGWDFTNEDMVKAGKRIFNMRHAFNLKAGLDPRENILPKRSLGEPPLEQGPLKGVTVDAKNLTNQFCDAIEWNRETFIPTKESLEKLGGMDDVIQDLY